MNKSAYFKLMGLNKIAAQTDNNNQIDKLKDNQLLSYTANLPPPPLSYSLAFRSLQKPSYGLPGYGLEQAVPKASRDYYNILTIGHKVASPARSFMAGLRGFFGLSPYPHIQADKQVSVSQVQERIKHGIPAFRKQIKDALKTIPR